MSIQGLRGSGDFVADQRPKNWREAILLLYPNGMAPLTGLISAMGSETTDDPEFNWWTKKFPSQRFTLGANAGTGTTITIVDDGRGGAQQLKKDHLLYVEETGEILRVSSDPTSATSISVERDFGNENSGTGTTVDYDGDGVNPYLTVIGTAHSEGSDAPTGINYDPTKNYNYTQIFRNTFEFTRTAMKTRLRTGEQVKEARREALELHGVEQERAYWFGVPRETVDAVSGKPKRMTGGILHWIEQGNGRTKSYTGAIDMDELEEDLLKIFEFGSDQKVAWCGRRAQLTINQIVRKNSSMQIESGIREFGMMVSKITTPFGELVMKTHPLFGLMAGGQNPTTPGTAFPGMDSSMVVLDMAALKYRHIQGDNMRFEGNLQDRGLDAEKNGFITEGGLEVHHPDRHFWLKNVSSAKVDD